MTGLEKVVLAITNGGSDKPYWHWINNGQTIRVYVADEQVLCDIPSFEGAGDFADAICLSGGIIISLSTEINTLNEVVVRLREQIDQLKKVGE
jgi:hypothetical protein